jgi:hypothetical protein
MTAITSAALVTGLAILVAVVLRDVRAGSDEQAGTEPEGAVADGCLTGRLDEPGQT